MTTRRLHRKKTVEKAQRVHETVYDPFMGFEGSKYELMVAKFFYFLRGNIRTVLIVLGASLAIVIGVIVFDIYRASREEKALLAYEELMKNPVMTGAADVSAAVKKLDDYAQEQGTDSAIKRSLVHKLMLLEKADKNKEAAEVAMQLAEKMDAVSLRVFFLSRAGSLFEGAGEKGASLTAIEKALALTTDEGEIRASLLFMQARMLRATGKESAVRQVIENLMKMDEKGHPEIIPIKQAALVFLLDEDAARN